MKNVVMQIASGFSPELVGMRGSFDVLFGHIDGVITAVEPLPDDDPRRPTYTCFVTIESE